MMAPDRVCWESPSICLARPKSVILGLPSSVIKTLAGFRSRWMMPRACGSAIARQSSITIVAAVTRWLRPATDRLGETAPGDKLQREVRQPVVVAVVVDLDNPRVLDLGDGVGLGVEPSDLVGGGVRPGQNHLQRDQSIQSDVPGFVDDAHAASADLRDDLVTRHVHPRPASDRRPVAGPRRRYDRRGLSRPPGPRRRPSPRCPAPSSTPAGDPSSRPRRPFERCVLRPAKHVQRLIHARGRRANVLATAGPRSPGERSRVRRRRRCVQRGRGFRRDRSRSSPLPHRRASPTVVFSDLGVACFAHRAAPLRLFRFASVAALGGLLTYPIQGNDVQATHAKPAPIGRMGRVA